VKPRTRSEASRRALAGAAVAVGALALVVVGGRARRLGFADVRSVLAVPAVAQALPPPACTPGEVTPAQTEGPFYKSGTPERTSLIEPEMAGTRLQLTGYVLTADCQPIPGAWLDFWQADANGQYDNRGYVLRGHQYADGNGRYSLETVVPAEYPGRTSHIHVKVAAPGGSILTSQLYFPNVGRNTRDSLFNPALLLPIQETADGQQASFDFVLKSE
jgi:protocatechuate 3,4-dioxygenase beta subunit